MRRPIVIEITQPREPVVRDTFIDDLQGQPTPQVQPRGACR